MNTSPVCLSINGGGILNAPYSLKYLTLVLWVKNMSKVFLTYIPRKES